MDVMAYKGYTGSIEFSAEDNVYFGKIIGIRSLISYEGETAKELLEDFHGAVDDYLAYKGIELITISSPTAYGEYTPYQFIDTEQEFGKG